GLLLGVNVILLFATILGELALVAEARPGVGVVRSRAQFLLALQDVEFTLEGGNFLLLRFDLSCPLLRLLFRIVRRLRLAGVGSFGVAGLGIRRSAGRFAIWGFCVGSLCVSGLRGVLGFVGLGGARSHQARHGIAVQTHRLRTLVILSAG